MAEAFVVVLLDFGSDLHEFEPIDEQVVVVDHLLLSFAFGVHIRERLDTIGEFVVLRKVMDDRFFDGAVRVASHADDRGKRARFWVSLIFEEGGIFRGFGPLANEGGPGLKRSQISTQAASSPVLCTLDPSLKEAGWWGRPRESADEAACRTSEVAKRLTLCVSNQEHGVVVVTHADFKRRLLDSLLGKSFEPLKVNRLSNAGVTKLKFDSGAWRLSYLDKVAHLPPRLVTGINV